MKKPAQAIMLILVLSCLTSFAMNVQAENWSWIRVASPANTSFQSVDMLSSTDGWAVGSKGSIARWDGTAWSEVVSPTSYKLACVSMVSSSEGWAIAQRTDGYQTNQ